MTARFDDLRPHRRRSFELREPEATIVATRRSEIRDALAAVEAAVGRGRWVAGFVAYEAAPAFDAALRVVDPSGTATGDLPLVWFSVYDRRHPVSGSEAGGYRLGPWEPTIAADDHRRAVTEIRDAIRRGDTYQVNHTFRLHTAFEGDAAALYQDLARSQTCGYGSYVDAGRWAVASASPELFFEWRHGRIVCRPMKGTVHRGTTLADDEAQRRRLLSSDKDRAENLMIVDMVRNDLGRISRTGTVEVPELFATEKYDTVWQMTSSVVAEPRPDVGLVDVFGALFPSASITGAPKVSTMEIIASLEQTPRGVYCGTVGFGGPGPGGPQWAFNVAIRTVLIDRRDGTATYGTGGGVTYDSTPGGEYAEALLKTRVLDRRSADLRLLETMRWEPEAGIPEFDRHLSRLSASAWYFDVPLDPAEVRAALDRSVAGMRAPRRLRLTVDRAGWIDVETSDLPPAGADPVRLAIDTERIDPADPFLHHKTTIRDVYEAAAERFPEADDVILVNRNDNVTETTVANVAAKIGGRWVTPPLTDGLLAGVCRAVLVDSGELAIGSLTPEDLESADELARFNSVRGWERAELVRH